MDATHVMFIRNGGAHSLYRLCDILFDSVGPSDKLSELLGIYRYHVCHLLLLIFTLFQNPCDVRFKVVILSAYGGVRQCSVLPVYLQCAFGYVEQLADLLCVESFFRCRRGCFLFEIGHCDRKTRKAVFQFRVRLLFNQYEIHP